MESEAFNVVAAAEHPSHEAGGPCHECAFRRGTQANQTPHTTALAAMCVEGLTPFYCHVHPGLCRGFVAAVNLRGVPETEADRHHAEACAAIADTLSVVIAAAKAVDTGRA